MSKIKTKTVKARRPKSVTSTGHYVTNDYILPLIIADKANNKILSPALAEALALIAERYSFSSNFIGYSFREDMVSFATVNLVANWHMFDESKYANPFAYYTQAAFHSFLQFIAQEQKHRDRKDKMLLSMGYDPSFSYIDRNKHLFKVELSDETAHRPPKR